MTARGQAHLGTSGLDCTLGDVNGWVFESDGARVRELGSRPAASLVFLKGNHSLISALAKTNKSTSSSKYGHNSHWEMFNSLYEQFRLRWRGTTCAGDTQHMSHPVTMFMFIGSRQMSVYNRVVSVHFIWLFVFLCWALKSKSNLYSTLYW